MADKLIIDWKEYNQIVEKLAIQIHKSGYRPNLLIGIMRGGAPIIDVLFLSKALPTSEIKTFFLSTSKINSIP